MEPIVIVGEGEFQRWVVETLLRMEGRIMALDASFQRMQASVTELAEDISEANQRVTDRLTAMQRTLDQFVAADATEDADYQALIDDLRAQLEAAQTANAVTAARVDVFSTSIEQASAAVEGIAPAAP